MTSSQEGIKIFENLKVSEHDQLKYKLVQLPNNLTALLIQDSETVKSAAALAVHAGSLKDYPEFQGIAHFLEHMLFMGSEKYPDENEYLKFIGASGGWSNAWTSLSITNYHFESSNAAFYEALDIFAQFYISPLLKEECVDKEVNAVDSEAKMNLKNDFWRRYQLKKSLSLEGSAYKQFSIGNLETLKKDGLMDALRKFHKEFYSANLMSLVICSPDDLDVMQQRVVEIFSPIPDHQIEYKTFESLKFPYDETNSQKLIRVVPVGEGDKLYLGFYFESYYKHQQDKVLNYYNHLFGHESEGSILNLLIEEGLGNELSASFEHMEDYYSELYIMVNLTKKGLKQYQKVVSVIGAYVNMLKEVGAQEYVFQEEKDVANLGFLYPVKPPGSRLCISYAEKLIKAAHRGDNLENFLYDNKAWGEFKPELINKVSENFVLEKGYILLVSKDFEGQTDQEEYFFKTQYSIEDIPEDVLQAFTNPDLSWQESEVKLHLPQKNTLIPTNFEVLPCETSEVKMVKETEDSQVWHRQDNIFKLPKVRAACQIYTNIDDLYTSAKSSVMKDLWVEVFDDSKRSMDYLAEMAKCNFSVSSCYKSNDIKGNCYSQSLAPYFEMLLTEMERYQGFNDQVKFDNIKQNFLNRYRNNQTKAPFRKFFGMATQILTKGKFTYGQMIEALESVSFEDFTAFSKKMYQRCRFEWLFEGNITSEQAVQVAESFEGRFKSIYTTEILPKDQLNPLRSIKLIENITHLLELPNLVPDDNNSCYMKLYQIGQGFEEYFAVANFIGRWLKADYFAELRTDQQLGYAVFALTRKYNGVYYVMFMIQSPVKETEHIRVQTQKFIEQWEQKLADMTPEEFQKIKDGCIAAETEKNNNLREQFNEDLAEIENHYYVFNRKEIKQQLLEKLTKEEIVAAYKRVLLDNSGALEVHQYFPQKLEEGIKIRQERLESEGEALRFVESTVQLKEQLDHFEDLTAVIR